ncbi:MAG: NF038122 family metalloprotease [Acidobacteriota bacterium]
MKKTLHLKRYYIASLLFVIAIALALNQNNAPVAKADNGGQKPINRPATIAPLPEAGSFVRYQDKDGNYICREAQPDEIETLLKRNPQESLRFISPIRTNQIGLNIMLRGTQQLENFPAAKQAFLKAAATWQSLIMTPITIIVDVDFGPTRFGQPYPPQVLGSTQSQLLITDYSDIKTGLLSSTDSEAEVMLYGLLPDGGIPTDIGRCDKVIAPATVFRALGIIDPAANPPAEMEQLGPPPSIGFNSNFQFDFDPSDGIDADKIDFNATALHEIGHVLGFTSSTGLKELLPDLPVSLSTWDLFRFRPTDAKLENFSVSNRIVSSGGDQVFFNGGSPLALSTGRPNGMGGDGAQSSHWKSSRFLGGNRIGIMDPFLSNGLKIGISNNDLVALDAFGHKTARSDAGPPKVTVIAPNGGEVINTNSQFTITWNASDDIGIVRQDITLSVNGGTNFPITITSGLAGNARSFVWTVPDMETSQAQIRINAVDGAGNQGFATSSNNFSIVKAVADTTPPTVQVTSPNGGEAITTGGQFNITWVSSDNSKVDRHDVLLSTDAGATFPVVITSGLPGNAQNFLWNVPALNTSQARISVVAFDAANNRGSDSSDNNFTVVGRDFDLSIAPASQTVTSGATTSFTVNLQSMGGFADPVNLSASFAPTSSNLTATFSANPVNAGGNATLTISTMATSPSGIFTVTITGTSGQLVRTKTVTLNVVAPDFALAFDPAQITVARGKKGTAIVNINRTGGFTGMVTVTAPDTKPLKIKFTQTSQSTAGTSLSFNFKVKKKAPTGPQQLTFTGRDENGRVRTGTLTLTIQ